MLRYKHFVILLILSFFFLGLFFSCRHQVLPPEKAIAQTLVEQTDSFIAKRDQLSNALNRDTKESELQDLFLKTRLAYKKIEWATEYFAPMVSRQVNGAPVEEVEMPSGKVSDPAGLQVIEAMLFPKFDSSKRQELRTQLAKLKYNTDKYTSYLTHIPLLDWQIFDAAKLEVFRILTLGISGFDAPLSYNSMSESAVALQSIQQALTYYTLNKSDSLQLHLSAAVTYLNGHRDFNSFDRASFITGYANAITTDITALQKHLNLHPLHYNRLLNQDAATLFDSNAFNANAFVPDMALVSTPQKVALGRELFSDPILSGDGSRSCQSCHQPGKAFTDGMARNTILNSNRSLKRNTPTLLNVALQPAQFYDIRVATLEQQAQAVMENKDEMHGSVKTAAVRLWQSEKYRRLFNAAFPRANRSAIDTIEVMNAIASYLRSLSSLDSRFDTYMRGDKTAMNEQEIKGFNVFMGKAKCGTCHYMPLFNGVLPPLFAAVDAEVIGVPKTKACKEIDGDMGRYDIVKVASQRYAFKTPTIRNAALTAPYMHNGIYATLDEVVDFYNKGGGAGLGLKVDNQTLPFDKLGLTKQECDQLVAFIKCLDSRN